MWTVLKFNKNCLNLLKKDLSEKLGSDPKYFIPTLKFQKLIRNKLYNKESFLLDDYLLCFHEKFKSGKTLNSLKYCKGLKYFLNGFINSQNEINDFINKCSKHIDETGYIKQSFFQYNKDKKFKFLSGPFTELIFKIVNMQHNKMKILISNFETTVSHNKYLFRPVL